MAHFEESVACREIFTSLPDFQMWERVVFKTLLVYFKYLEKQHAMSGKLSKCQYVQCDS